MGDSAQVSKIYIPFDSIDDYQWIMTKKSYAQAFFNNLNRELFLLPFSAFAVIQNGSFSTLDLGTQKRQCYPTLPFMGFSELWMCWTHWGTRHRINSVLHLTVYGPFGKLIILEWSNWRLSIFGSWFIHAQSTISKIEGHNMNWTHDSCHMLRPS